MESLFRITFILHLQQDKYMLKKKFKTNIWYESIDYGFYTMILRPSATQVGIWDCVDVNMFGKQIDIVFNTVDESEIETNETNRLLSKELIQFIFKFKVNFSRSNRITLDIK